MLRSARALCPFLFPLAALGAGCTSTTRPDFVVHVVSPSGANPFLDPDFCANGTLNVDVWQPGGEVLTQHATITGGTIGDLTVSIPSYGALTRIHARADCSGGSVTGVLGATPQFVPIGYPGVDVVVGAPGTCVELSAPTLAPARVAPALVALGANVLVFGGRSSSGSPQQRIQVVDPVQLTSTAAGVGGAFDPLTVGIGVGGAVVLDATRVAFVSDTLDGIYETSQSATGDRLSTLAVHTGAGDASAIVDLGGSGMAVVGGFDGTAAVDTITWVPSNGNAPTTGHLVHPRRRPTAVLFAGGRLLVVGGQAAGAPLFEIVTPMGSSSATFGPTDARYAPLVATDRTRMHAFVALGTADPDGTGAILDTTLEVGACTTDGCTAQPGETWPGTLRRGFAVVAHDVGTSGYETLVFGGVDAAGMPTQAADRIEIAQDGMASVTTFGHLAVARDRPGAVAIASGVVLVAGGADAAGNALGGIEICFPTELAPINAD